MTTLLVLLLGLLVARPPDLTIERPLPHRAIAVLVAVAVARDRRELRDLALAMRTERSDPREVSRTGCAGVWQLAPCWGLSRARLARDPLVSTLMAVRAYREFRAACGAAWHTCWLRGPAAVLNPRRS